jgi:hypothetical protein
MIFFMDVSGLERALQRACAVPREARRAFIVTVLERWEFAREPASLCADAVLGQNDDGSAGRAAANARRVSGSWVRGEQQGMAAAALRTMKETWKFKDDLTYAHKVESYEGYSSPFGSSYSLPKSSVEQGIWAPTDWDSDRLDLFVMPFDGTARRVALEWIEQGNLKYRACTILGARYGREW